MRHWSSQTHLDPTYYKERSNTEYKHVRTIFFVKITSTQTLYRNNHLTWEAELLTPENPWDETRLLTPVVQYFINCAVINVWSVHNIFPSKGGNTRAHLAIFTFYVLSCCRYMPSKMWPLQMKIITAVCSYYKHVVQLWHSRGYVWYSSSLVSIIIITCMFDAKTLSKLFGQHVSAF